ncbi:hypothetical protein GWI33_005840 [Rhynchophorus ferrugineus]|uniref:Uncharacterized protein n=1 Tax=Rhynchophorus ferrugineus TaxID=354439 RepID=A0A834MFS0_RHYFE|nr:hypothetical protein GWI33_005840 [Rhynchophorus ferrugineus]
MIDFSKGEPSLHKCEKQYGYIFIVPITPLYKVDPFPNISGRISTTTENGSFKYPNNITREYREISNLNRFLFNNFIKTIQRGAREPHTGRREWTNGKKKKTGEKMDKHSRRRSCKGFTKAIESSKSLLSVLVEIYSRLEQLVSKCIRFTIARLSLRECSLAKDNFVIVVIASECDLQSNSYFQVVN